MHRIILVSLLYICSAQFISGWLPLAVSTHSFLPLQLGGILFLKFGYREAHEKIVQKQRGQLKGGEVVLIERREGFTFFSLFCKVNVHTFCNQKIYSFMWFTFYQKMMYYEISFPVTLYFLIELSRFLLLMTFISISISLKTSNILENKSQVFERSNCTITVLIDLYYNELMI